jgi:nucleotide-binding universal stress UspA family protein
MFKHVLVPLDGSEIAEKALGYAQQIADPNGGRITLLTALDVPEYPPAMYYPAGVATYEINQQTMNEQIIPQAQEYLQRIAQTFTEAGYATQIEAVIGEAAQTIVEHAEKHDVEVIVMSTHGRTGFSRWLFGSVASKVLGSARCPVFVIPARCQS